MRRVSHSLIAAIVAIATLAAVTLTGTARAAASGNGGGLLGTVLAALKATPASQPSTGNVTKVTRRNRAPKPDYFGTCAQLGFNDPVCIAQSVAAIEHARKHDHRVTKQALILPNNYRALSVAEQTFVIINLERVDRGIRPIEGLIPKLNLLSKVAALLRLDPILSELLASLLGAGKWASIWSSDLGPLPSDYDWMYNDGYGPTGSINLACTKPTSPGCWGHRRNILNRFIGMPTLVAGAGTAKPRGASISELSAGLRRTKSPHYTYTWQQALNHGANGHKVLSGT